MEKAVKATNVARGFIYTLVRRKWVKGFRIVKKTGGEACSVYPGREYSSTITIPDITAQELEKMYDPEMFVTKAHMYRFDKKSQKHVIDEIAFYKHRRWPNIAYIPFAEPEPPQDSSLENRNRWERWNQAKLANQQSDSAQLHLVSSKLSQLDEVIVAVYQQLESTIAQMREMSDAVMRAFEAIPLPRLRAFVASIPGQIKEVAREMEKTSGIIINGDNMKLTPIFLESFLVGKGVSDSVKKEAEEKAKSDAVAKVVKEEKLARRDSLVSLAGIPIHTLMPMLKGKGGFLYNVGVMLNSEIRKSSSNSEKLNRRYTYVG